MPWILDADRGLTHSDAKDMTCVLCKNGEVETVTELLSNCNNSSWVCTRDKNGDSIGCGKPAVYGHRGPIYEGGTCTDNPGWCEDHSPY